MFDNFQGIPMTGFYEETYESAAWVYELFGENGTLLYVGRATHLLNRLRTHSQEKAWWVEVRKIHVIGCTTRIRSSEVEQYLISKHKPPYNKVPGYVLPTETAELKSQWRHVSDDAVLKILPPDLRRTAIAYARDHNLHLREVVERSLRWLMSDQRTALSNKLAVAEQEVTRLTSENKLLRRHTPSMWKNGPITFRRWT